MARLNRGRKIILPSWWRLWRVVSVTPTVAGIASCGVEHDHYRSLIISDAEIQRLERFRKLKEEPRSIHGTYTMKVREEVQVASIVVFLHVKVQSCESGLV